MFIQRCLGCKGHCFLTLLLDLLPRWPLALNTDFMSPVKSFIYHILYQIFYCYCIFFRRTHIVLKKILHKININSCYINFSSTSYWFKIEEEVNREDLHWIRIGYF